MEYVIAGLLLMAALYLAGWMPVRVMRAVTFIGNGSWRSRCFGASFTWCTGRIHRILRVGESRSFAVTDAWVAIDFPGTEASSASQIAEAIPRRW